MPPRNLSRRDRLTRVIAGSALLVLGPFVVRSWPAIFLVAGGALLVFSGSVGFCHVYQACGLDTLHGERGRPKS